MSLLLPAIITIAFAAIYAVIIAMVGERAGDLRSALGGNRFASATSRRIASA